MVSIPEDLNKDGTWNSKKDGSAYNDGLEQTVTNWLLTMDCCSQLKSHFSKSAGNMATVSNSPPRLEPSPSSSKLVDKTGSKGKTWSYFADRAHQNKYPVDMLEIQRQT